MPKLTRIRWHILSRLKRSQRPEAILFFDTEATLFDAEDTVQCHMFRLGVGCLCEYVKGEGLVEREWKEFDSPESIWNYVTGLANILGGLVVVAHNMDYDARLSQSFGRLPEKGYSPTLCVMTGSCTLYIWEKGKVEITLLDSMNFWPEKLETLGECVGLKKIPVDFRTATREELLAHCHRDVEILVRMWQGWLDFLDQHDLGSFGYTAASQAFKAYRHRFMPEEIAIHDSTDIISLEREAYHGGRTECFAVSRLPEGEYYQVDVNGLYAAVMGAKEYPRRLRRMFWAVTLPEMPSLLKKYCLIAEVVVSTHAPVYPFKIGGRNCYPVGTFMTVLTTPELERAVSLGEIRGIGRVAAYEKADLFSEYIQFFQGLRLGYKSEGDKVRERLCKLFYNSLQGKFGQHGRKQEKVGDAQPSEIWSTQEINAETGEFESVICFGGSVLRTHNVGEARESFPAIPAHVCAYGRMFMWALIEKAGREHVFYTDTDSLIVDQVGYDNLADMMDPVKLGMLKLVGVAEDVEINARKDYRFGAKRVLKGIKGDAEELMPHLYQQWHYTSLRFALREGQLDGVVAKRVQKNMWGGHFVGEILEDGRVAPLRVNVDAEHLLRYLEESDRHNRKHWTFSSAYLEGRTDLGFLLEQREEELRWQALIATLPQLCERPAVQPACAPIAPSKDPSDLASDTS